jgi:hypothetical protein
MKRPAGCYTAGQAVGRETLLTAEGPFVAFLARRRSRLTLRLTVLHNQGACLTLPPKHATVRACQNALASLGWLPPNRSLLSAFRSSRKLWPKWDGRVVGSAANAGWKLSRTIDVARSPGLRRRRGGPKPVAKSSSIAGVTRYRRLREANRQTTQLESWRRHGLRPVS